MHPAPCPNVLKTTPTPAPFQAFSRGYLQAGSVAASTARRQMAQSREAYANCLQSTCYGCVACSEVAYRRNIYASLNGPLDLDDVELLSGKQSRLTGVVLRVACMFTGLPESVSFGACYLTVCDITCYLLMVDYVSVSLFCISVSSAHFAHFVANFISSHVVQYLDCIFVYLHNQ